MGSDGSALHNSLSGEDFDGGSVMKQTLHILNFDATYEANLEIVHGRVRGY
jgi:hypothetical protein